MNNLPKSVKMLYQEIKKAQEENRSIEGFQLELNKRGYRYTYLKELIRLPLIEYISVNKKGLSIEGLKKESFEKNTFIMVSIKNRETWNYEIKRINLSYNKLWFSWNYAFQTEETERDWITNAKTLTGIKEKLKKFLLDNGFKEKGNGIKIEKETLDLNMNPDDEVIFWYCFSCGKKAPENSLDNKGMCLECKRSLWRLEKKIKEVGEKKLLAREILQNKIDFINTKKENKINNILIKYLNSKIKVNIRKDEIKEYMKEKGYSYKQALKAWYLADVEGEKWRIVGYNNSWTIAYIDFDNKKIYEVEHSLYYEKSEKPKIRVNNYIFWIYLEDIDILGIEEEKKEEIIQKKEIKIFEECNLCHKKVGVSKIKKGICPTCKNYIEKNISN